MGSWCSLVNTPACQAGDRQFKSGRPRFILIKMPYWIYILEDEISGRYYIGQTADLDKRIERHNAGRSKFTRGGKWKIIYTEKFDSRSEAIHREQQIKKWKSRKAIQKLIKSKD